MKNARFQILDAFALKVLALVLMSLDHVGAFIELTYLPVNGTPLYVTALVLRAVGRLAFPLFAFFVAEGMQKTHDRGNYLLRFAILFVAILIVQAGVSYLPSFGALSAIAQPFGDLLCYAAIAYLYEKGGRWRFLIALPVLYLTASGIVNILGANGFSIPVPAFLLAQYNILGLFVFLGLYFLPKFLDRQLESAGLLLQEGEEKNFPNPSTYGPEAYRRHLNALSAASIAAVFALFWAIAYLTPYIGFRFEPLSGMGISFEMYGILGSFFLLLYDGKRGYRAKWWVYFEWSYFPVHIVFLAAVFALISL